ncbi:MAG: hypothetical protein ACOX2F_07390 [bacterium]
MFERKLKKRDLSRIGKVFKCNLGSMNIDAHFEICREGYVCHLEWHKPAVSDSIDKLFDGFLETVKLLNSDPTRVVVVFHDHLLNEKHAEKIAAVCRYRFVDMNPPGIVVSHHQAGTNR